MFDDADELDDEEGHVTGLMSATGINDDDDDEMVDVGVETTQVIG